MRVQLKRRWAARLPGQIASVSDERAKVMVEAGIAKYIKGEEPKQTKAKGKK